LRASWNLHSAGTPERGSILLDAHSTGGAKQAGGILPPVTVVQDNGAIFMP
jgi:hypothetical protein